MSTLLLRLAGPLQAWGSSSKFNTRYTDREPTKSGVIGMISSAMGRSRNEPIEDLNSLRFGVRVDQEGELQKDFHTAHSERDQKLSFISSRHYLSDALFIVGLEGDIALLNNIESAIKSPVYPLFLGRRACPPTVPVTLGIRDAPLIDALCNEPWMAAEWYRKSAWPTINLKIICDAVESDELSIYAKDRPISFAQVQRKYGYRNITYSTTGPINNQLSKKKSKKELPTEHDPIAEVKEYNRGE